MRWLMRRRRSLRGRAVPSERPRLRMRSYDDRCDDEQREADISRAHSADCMASYGVPYDPYDDGDEE
jgi:hypothetical protein